MFLRHLRATREASGLNQREVAERLKESINYVSRRERGEHRMDILELLAYCEAIGKPAAELVQEVEDLIRQGRIGGPPQA